MICYNCGTKLTSDETTCPACGKKQAIPDSLLDDAKNGDRNSIIGLYNYSYASVYETVEAYLTEEDEIQNMIKKVYIETFRRLSEISSAEQFRPFLNKIAMENLATRTPIEKEASPSWLIIPETQTLRQILEGIDEDMEERAHRAAELELMKRYNLDFEDDEIVESDSTNDKKAESNAANGTEQSSNGNVTGTNPEDEDEWLDDDEEEGAGNRSENISGQAPNPVNGEEDSLENALRQVASSASEDWSSLGFSQTQFEEEEEPMPSRLPLILGIVLAIVAVAVVVILVIGALGNRSSNSKKQNTTTSESQSQAGLVSESETDSEMESQSDSEESTDQDLANAIESLLGTEELTEAETESSEVDATGNLLMSDDIPLDEEELVVLGNDDLLRSDVGTVTFLDTLADAPEDAWDVSANGDGLVMAWIVLDESSDLYDLYVAGEGGVYANEDSAYLFAFYDSATSISFNGYFYTTNATDMSGMFYECALLEDLDLNGFDTSAVTNMSYMFYDCVSLADVDVSSFNTSEVTAMSYMFTSCEALTELTLSGFDFTNVTDMEYMLAGCSSLETVDIDLTDATDEVNTEGMYEGTAIE